MRTSLRPSSVSPLPAVAAAAPALGACASLRVTLVSSALGHTTHAVPVLIGVY